MFVSHPGFPVQCDLEENSSWSSDIVKPFVWSHRNDFADFCGLRPVSRRGATATRSQKIGLISQ